MHSMCDILHMHFQPVHFFDDTETAYFAFLYTTQVLALTLGKKPLYVELPSVFQRRPVLGRGPALHSWSWGWSRAKLTSRTLPLSWMLRSYRHPSRVDRFLGTSTAHCLSTSWFWRWTCSVQHVGSFSLFVLHTTVIARLCLTEWCWEEHSAGWVYFTFCSHTRTRITATSVLLPVSTSTPPRRH